MTKTFIVKAILKGSKAPNFGAGKGVIAEYELDFTSVRPKDQFQDVSLELEKLRWEKKMTESLLKFEWKEK